MESYLEDLHGLLVGKFGVRQYHLVFRNVSGDFDVTSSHPAAPTWLAGCDFSGMCGLFDQSGPAWLHLPEFFRIGVSSMTDSNLERCHRELGIDYCFSVFSKELPVGLLLLSGREAAYSRNDLEFLEFVAKGLGEVCYNAILAQEMEYVGWISRGLAHDFQSLLTPISTYLQLCMEGQDERMRAEALLPEAMRSLDMLRSCIKEGLVFGKNQKPQIRAVRFEELVRMVLGLAAVQLQRKTISVRVEATTGLELELDEILAVRLMLNLVLNGIMAAPEGSAMEIRASKVIEEGEWWVRVEICDQGPGISEERIREAAAPYGNGGMQMERSSGLGLSICNRIAQLHGGKISFLKNNDGTRVRVDFPLLRKRGLRLNQKE
jgi:two-component sensor histidine kinase